jgi:septum formation protein
MTMRPCQKKFQVVQSLNADFRTVTKTVDAYVKLVLASTSRYRRELLARLGIPFAVAAPQIDERRLPGESPESMAARLACAKALAVAPQFPEALIIGSDQVAVCNGDTLEKPGNRDRAFRQLMELSGREATFHTAVCVHGSKTGMTCTRTVPYRVRFRKFDSAQIERYLAREQAFDCAGSAKVEGLGIVLIEKMQGDDPNALIGLPLIALIELLREQGLEVI